MEEKGPTAPRHCLGGGGGRTSVGGFGGGWGGLGLRGFEGAKYGFSRFQVFSEALRKEAQASGLGAQKWMAQCMWANFSGSSKP